MKQKLLRFSFLSVFVLLFTSGAWATDVAYKTLTFSSSTNSAGVQAYNASWSATISGFTWNLQNFSNNNNAWSYAACGHKSKTYVGTITTNSAIDKAITQVVANITFAKADDIEKVNSAKLYVATNAGFTTGLQTIDITEDLAQGNNTFTISTPTENCYYKLEFDCKSGSKNGWLQVNSVTYYVAPSNIAAPTLSKSTGDYFAPFSLSITTNAVGGETYYTLDESTPSKSSPKYGTTPIAISSTTTIKAVTYVGDELSDLVTATYTFPVVANLPFTETFNTNDAATNYTGGNDGKWNGGIATGNPVNSDVSGWIFTTGYGASKCIKLGSGSAQGSAETPYINFESGKSYLLTFKAGAWNSDSEATGLNLSISNGSLNKTSVTMAKGAFTSYTVEITGTTGPARITFEAGQANSNRFFLDEVKVVELESVTIGDAKYATYCSTNDLDFSGTDITVYKAKVDGGVAKFTEVTDGLVPAGAGVILYCATADTYSVPTTTGVEALSDNELVGVTARTQIVWNADTKYNYILQQSGSSIVFNKANDGYLTANHAYLSTTYNVDAAGARELAIDFGDATAIEGLDAIGTQTAPRKVVKNGRVVIETNEGTFSLNGARVQ